MKPYFFSDFIFDPEYFEESLQRIINFLFQNLKCNFIKLVPEKNSLTLQKIRMNKVFYVSETHYPGHLVLNMPENLAEFRKMGRKRVRRDFERTS